MTGRDWYQVPPPHHTVIECWNPTLKKQILDYAEFGRLFGALFVRGYDRYAGDRVFRKVLYWEGGYKEGSVTRIGVGTRHVERVYVFGLPHPEPY
jgi:hypothetical protein